MRTTITLTPESESLIQRLMRDRRLTFKDAVNEAIARGLTPSSKAIETPTFDLGHPSIPVEHALQVAGDLEDEALLAKWDLGK